MNVKTMNTCSTCECSLETQIGLLEISCCKSGVHSIHICEKENTSASTLNNAIETVDDPSCLTETLEWLKSYFEGPVLAKCTKPPAVCPQVMRSKGVFTELVWSTLKDAVPAGSTVTYGGLAALCGRSGAARAVGTAMRRNPAPLLVPCHRVVKGGGALGNYSGGGGACLKEWLLRHEGAGLLGSEARNKRVKVYKENM